MAVMLSFAASAFAQIPEQSSLRIKEEGKTVFNPHWYMQVQAGAAFTRGEIRFGDMLSPSVAVYGGYQFTPLWGLRAGIGGWQAKGAWVSPQQIYAYDYLQGNIDATLDLSNLFGCYSPDRLFNAYLFAGIGLNGSFSPTKAFTVATDYQYDPEYSRTAFWDINLRLRLKKLMNVQHLIDMLFALMS